MALNTKESDALIKKLMADVGMPNSQSLCTAFQKLRAMVGPDSWQPQQLLNEPLSRMYEALTEAQSCLAAHTRDDAGHIPENVHLLNPSDENLRAAKHALRAARGFLKDHKSEQKAQSEQSSFKQQSSFKLVFGAYSGSFVDTPPVQSTQEERLGIAVFTDVKLLQLSVATNSGMTIKAENLLGMTTVGILTVVIRGELLSADEAASLYGGQKEQYNIHEIHVSHSAYNFRIQDGFLICDIQVIDSPRGRTLQAMGAAAVKWTPRFVTAGSGDNLQVRLFAVDAVVL